MLFEAALQALRSGAKLRRPGWPNNWRYLIIQTKLSFTEPYIIADTGTPEDMEWPYHCSRTDLLASDWEIV